MYVDENEENEENENVEVPKSLELEYEVEKVVWALFLGTVASFLEGLVVLGLKVL